AYARFDTPAWSHFEEALAKLEHAELPGLVFGSGLAAISAVISAVPAGGTLIIPTHSYQGALASAAQIAERQGCELVTVDLADTAAVTAAMSAMSTVTSSNPCLSAIRSEEHTSELQSRFDLVCRILLE